jgi:hypothetical protein
MGQTGAGQPAVGQAAVEHGLITLRAENQPLQPLLEDISARTGISIEVSPEIGKTSTTVDFRRTPLDAALRQMLAGSDVILLYAEGTQQGPESLKSVWAYPPNQAPLEVLSAGKWKETNKGLEEEVSGADDDDSPSRIAEVDMLIRREGRQALAVVQNALKSPSEKMRHQALHRALAVGVPLPEETLTSLALNDSSQEVRYLALQALPIDPRLKWVADRAAQDPSVQVSTEAKEILHEFEPRSTASTDEANQ